MAPSTEIIKFSVEPWILFPLGFKVKLFVSNVAAKSTTLIISPTAGLVGTFTVTAAEDVSTKSLSLLFGVYGESVLSIDVQGLPEPPIPAHTLPL